ncbi:MAG: hypothetical protein KJ060_12475 [Candidatus Hydrogenedentes bacterium]|nr:hypothetical protein [Candidatus Hydrogenedentota bacterium]
MSAKAHAEPSTNPKTGGDVPVTGSIADPDGDEKSPETWARTQQLLDRLLWQAFTKRGRHENNVR